MGPAFHLLFPHKHWSCAWEKCLHVLSARLKGDELEKEQRGAWLCINESPIAQLPSRSQKGGTCSSTSNKHPNSPQTQPLYAHDILGAFARKVEEYTWENKSRLQLQTGTWGSWLVAFVFMSVLLVKQGKGNRTATRGKRVEGKKIHKKIWMLKLMGTIL